MMNLEEQPNLENQNLETDKNKSGVLSDEKYQQFADSEKARWAEMGVNPLVEAGERKRSVEIDLENERNFAEKYNEKTERLRADIDEKKSRFLSRILEFRQIKALERDLGVAEHSRDSAERRTKSQEELFAAYDRISAEQQELSVLVEEAQKENTEWDENKRIEMIEEENKRDIGSLTKTHNTYFVHDIVDAEWKPSANNQALNTKNLTFEDQLDILSGLGPTISVSTLDHGKTNQRTFGKGWGAFISSGRIVGGGRSDIGSIAVGLRDRRVSTNDASLDSIENAITGRGYDEPYNELIVEQPEIAGVYCRIPNDILLTENVSLQNGNGVRYDSWWGAMQNVMSRNVLIFVLTSDNKTHLLYDIDLEKRTFKVAGDMRPEDIADMPGIYKQHLGKDEKKAAVGRVFDNVSHLLTDKEKTEFVPDGTADNLSESPYQIH